MKKVLSILLVLAMLATTVSVVVFAEDAALGTYDNPYLLDNTAQEATTITVPAETAVTIKVNNSNGSVVNVVSASSTDYFFWYCRQTYNSATSLTMVSDVDTFTLENSGAADLVISLKLTGGGEIQYGTMDRPEELTLATNMFGGIGADAERALEAGNQGYYFTVTAPDTGVMAVSAGAMDADYNYIGWMYFVNNITQGKYGNYNYSDAEEPVYYEEIKVSAGDELQIFVTTYDPESPWNNPAGNITVSVSFSPVGSYSCPEEITNPGSFAPSVAAGNWSGYNYTWTATEAGTATVTIDSASNWAYNISGITAAEEYFYFGDMHWSDDEPVVPSESVAVNAGDTLSIMINTYDPETGMAIDGSVNWTFSFAAGEGNPDQGGGDDIGGGDIGGDEGGSGDGDETSLNYILLDDMLAVGTNSFAASNEYAYSLYTFEPSETGKYTFTSTDSLIALVSTNGMWVNVGASTDYISDDVVTENTFEWTCTGVGQTIWVAALPETNVATITVDFEEVEIKETPREYYENTKKPEAFTFNGNADDLLYVDTFDANADKAVLGEDGYYHLNSADGPILYANLDDVLMSLSQANGYGQLKYLIYDDAGEIVKMIDYTVAMIDYLAAMDLETGLYPLTADIIEVFKNAGAYQGWYGETGWVGGELEDSWMFACYYSEDIKVEGDIPPAGNDVPENVPPSDPTGDSFALITLVALAALCGMATVVIIRKRRTTSK